MTVSTRRSALTCVKSPTDDPNEHSPGSYHAGLWLDKFIVDQNGSPSGNDNRKATAKAALVRETANIPIQKDYQKTFFPLWKAGLLSLQSDKRARVGVAKVQGRMAVGLGDEAVLETSISLHRVYGVPVIPGSALKGLAAAYARNHIGGVWEKSEKAYVTVFGKADESGYVVFHDALYIPGSAENRPLRPDVITVHHPDYYQNKENAAPADWDSPTPIPFLSATGDYLLAISSIPDCEVWLDRAWRVLTLALAEEGIGTKTSSGYGRMTVRDCEG